VSKIYEALEHANKAKGKGSDLPIPVSMALKEDELVLREEMLGLYKMIEALLPDMKSRVIQFISTREGEGTSTIVREFSKLAADHIGHNVLLLEADRCRPGQKDHFKIPSQYSWIDALKRGEDIGGAVHHVPESNLHVSFACNDAGSTPEFFNSPVFDTFCNVLRSEFDLVLIDSAPFSVSPDGLAIASKVDGIVLVIEAERTKWQAVKLVKDSFNRVGGNILGSVLNKRRYYIPEYIYKFL